MKEAKMLKPQTEYINICKVAGTIAAYDGVVNSGKWQIMTIPRKNVSTLLEIWSDDNLTLSNIDITPYDLVVMDAVYTLYVNGATDFTPEMVMRVMSGNMHQDATSRRTEDIIKSIDKLAKIRISIDCTDEFVIRKKINKGQTVQLDSYLLPIDIITIKSANHRSIKKGYTLLNKPVLYEYAEQVNQIINIPINLLALTTGILTETADVTLIKRYLIKRIELMKNSRNRVKSSKIIYEWYDEKTQLTKGMLRDIGYNKDQYSKWRDKKSKLHRIVITILELFVDNGYISGYNVLRDVDGGKTSAIRGIEIVL